MNKLSGAAVSLALLLAGCAQYGARPGTSEVTLSRYVALGSSMASGPGVGPIKPGTPPRCTRTFGNYPTLLAEKLRLTLVDVTCSGATSTHVLEPWNELPAQIDAVTADTKLVTISIGGNDLNYVGGLLAATCGESATIDFSGQSMPCPERRAPSEADYARLEANLAKIAREVKKRAPKAHLVFVQYPQLVPPELCDKTPLTSEDALAARQIGDRLAQITKHAARNSGSLIVPAYEWSVGHTPCDAEPYALGYASGSSTADGAPWHYNQAGMEQTAEWIAYVLGDK